MFECNKCTSNIVISTKKHNSQFSKKMPQNIEFKIRKKDLTPRKDPFSVSGAEDYS